MTPATSRADTSASILALRQHRFESLVLPHVQELLGFASRRAATTGDGEDAVQDACARAWGAFDELRDETRVRAWLFTILRTVLSDQAERAGRRARLVPMSRLEDLHESVVASADDDVFTEVVNRLDREMLAAALEAIPDDFATAVELHDIAGFKYIEIAELLSIPIGTVMSRISRGRRLLAGVIADKRKQWALGVPASTRVGASRRGWST